MVARLPPSSRVLVAAANVVVVVAPDRPYLECYVERPLPREAARRMDPMGSWMSKDPIGNFGKMKGRMAETQKVGCPEMFHTVVLRIREEVSKNRTGSR